MLDLAKDQYPYLPVPLLLKDTYRNDITIEHVSSPILFLHGKKDIHVKYEYGQKLYEAANEPKKLITYEEGDHTNLYNLGVHNAITEFINSLPKK